MLTKGMEETFGKCIFLEIDKLFQDCAILYPHQ